VPATYSNHKRITHIATSNGGGNLKEGGGSFLDSPRTLIPLFLRPPLPLVLPLDTAFQTRLATRQEVDEHVQYRSNLACYVADTREDENDLRFRHGRPPFYSARYGMSRDTPFAPTAGNL